MSRFAFTFRAFGLVGREVVEAEPDGRVEARVRACSEFEQRAIEGGYATFECGCCLAGVESGGDLESVRQEAL